MNSAGERATTTCLEYLLLPLALLSTISIRALRSSGTSAVKRGASSSALRRSRDRSAAKRDFELLYR